ncbi:MAG: hypothetical protein LBK99_24740 [Opitutaceae bacterium]|nr:hypothetical protein [Opitutaceae bacterium]
MALSQALTLAASLLFAAPSLLTAATTVSWDGNGTPDADGNWSIAANWSADALPAANDSVQLGNVATGSRTISFDADITNLTLSALAFSQTTSGTSAAPIANLLALPVGKTLTVTDAIALGASATDASVGITINGPAAANSTIPALVASKGITVGAGGVLTFKIDAANNRSFRALDGNLTLEGGAINITAPGSPAVVVDIGAVSTDNNNKLAGNDRFEIKSGLLQLNSGASGGARLQFNGNLDWAGGTIQFVSRANGIGAQQLILRGQENTIGADAVFQTITGGGATTRTVAPDIYMKISSGGGVTGTEYTQTLTSAVALGNIGIVEDDNGARTYIHVITSTAADPTIGQVALNSSNGSGATTNIIKLGSDLRSTNTTEKFVTVITGNKAGIYGIDLNGHTFDGTASTAGWRPNDSGTATPATQWQVTSTATDGNGSGGNGTLKARFFNLALSDGTGGAASAADSVTIGSRVTLEATGGANTINTLSVTGAATYAIAADSIFLYSGNAPADAAATVTSTEAIGALEVRNGALKLDQATLTTRGDVTITANGALDLNGASSGTLVLAAGKNFSATNATLLLNAGDAGSVTPDQIQSDGSGAFSLSNTTLVLSPGSGFVYTSSWQLFSGFATGSVSGITITGYDTANWTATLGSDGILSFATTAVPEPRATALLISGLLALAVAGYGVRHKKSRIKN